MNIDEKIFERASLKAPDDFVSKTMRYINEQEAVLQQKSVKNNQNAFYTAYNKLGKAMVTAAILMVIFNILPYLPFISVSYDKINIPSVPSFIEIDKDYTSFNFKIDKLNISELVGTFRNKFSNTFNQGE